MVNACCLSVPHSGCLGFLAEGSRCVGDAGEEPVVVINHTNEFLGIEKFLTCREGASGDLMTEELHSGGAEKIFVITHYLSIVPEELQRILDVLNVFSGVAGDEDVVVAVGEVAEEAVH